MSPLERVNRRESIVRSQGGALLVADCKDCQAALVKGVFSVWSWRISWLMRVVFPIPGNPTIEMAMGTPPSPPLVRGGARVGDSLVRGGARVGDSLVRAGARVGDSLVRGGARVGDSLVRGGARVGDSLVRGGARVGDSLVRAGATIRVFKVSISFVRCTQFLTGGKFSGRGKVRSLWLSWGISAIAAAKSNSVSFISLRSIISSQLLIPTALQISINVSRRIRFCAQNLLKVAFEVRAALHQVSSLLFHPRLRLTMSMIFSPSSDALSKPAIATPLRKLCLSQECYTIW